MKVSEVMSTEPAYCTSGTKVQEVAKMMVEHDCGAIPVVESETSRRPVGVITDRDITTRLVAQGHNPLHSIAQDAMTPAAVAVSQDAEIEDAARAMQKNRLRRVVVVSGDGCCVGMLALADVADALPERQSASVLKQVSRPNLRSSAAV